MYRFAKFPKDAKLVHDVHEASNRLEQKLSNLNVDALEISDYNKRYLSEHREHINSYMQRLSFVLVWGIQSSVTPYDDLVFVEYGGGTGGLALLAKELGIGTVIYSDIYDVSCKDAEKIAASLKIVADEYICGELDEIVECLNRRKIGCDAITSNDVIEHIYDVDKFIKDFGTVPGKRLTIAFSSYAHTLNPLIARRLKKYHHTKENEDQKKVWGAKERDAFRAFKTIRREMIQAFKPDIEPDALEKLVKNTRGLMEQDIKKYVVEYSEKSAFPPEPAHPTNTCDPYTGNWAEQLLDMDHLKAKLDSAGFDSKVLGGYYGGTSQIRKILSPILNSVICLGGHAGLRIAPYFLLHGVRRSA